MVEHIAQVSSVSVELVERVVSTVVEVLLISPQACSYYDDLTCVPNEKEIRTVLKLMKNDRSPFQHSFQQQHSKLKVHCRYHCSDA